MVCVVLFARHQVLPGVVAVEPEKRPGRQEQEDEEAETPLGET